MALSEHAHNSPMMDSSSCFKKFVAADWASDLDLGEAWPGYAGGRVRKLPRMVCFTGGNLNVRLNDGSTTVLLDQTPLAGLLIAHSPRHILNASTTATAVWVWW